MTDDMKEDKVAKLQNRKQELELKLAEKDLQIKDKELKKQNPIIIGVFAALIGLLSSSLVSYINGINQINHAKQQLENQLIINAVNSSDIKNNRENLQQLIELGLIRFNREVITKILSDSTSSPKLDLNGYTWDLGDSDLNSSPVLSFDTIGTYRINLSVDNEKLKDTSSKTITVYPVSKPEFSAPSKEK